LDSISGKVVKVNCNQVMREISEYLDGELTPEMKGEIERHLAGCGHCRTVLDQVRMTIDIFCDQQKITLSPEISARLHQAVKRRLSAQQ
jgi:anti-sigma factor RsiW